MTEVAGVGADACVRLRPLSMVDEGDDEVLVGDPATGEYVTIPKVGAIVIAALQEGHTVGEAAAAAEAFAGQIVDVASFVETLRDLEFLDEGQEPVPMRSAPIQSRSWLAGVRPELVRPFFGRLAWCAYGCCALFVILTFILWPQLFPNPTKDPFVSRDTGLGALILIPITLTAAALHEIGHWLACRAAGVRSRFGMDRRAVVLLVFETDLTQIWSLPRGKRYSPLLAGIAVDFVLLAIALALRLPTATGHGDLPRLLDQLLAAWIYAKLAGLLWQCMVFLRTDLYAVLVNALGCRNLWQVSNVMLRARFRGLDPARAAELVAAHPRDVRVGSWFQWLRVVGAALVAAWAAFFLAPFVWELLRWTAHRIAGGPGEWQFWWALLCAVLALAPYILPLLLTAGAVTRTLRARAISGSPATT